RYPARAGGRRHLAHDRARPPQARHLGRPDGTGRLRPAVLGWRAVRGAVAGRVGPGAAVLRHHRRAAAGWAGLAAPGPRPLRPGHPRCGRGGAGHRGRARAVGGPERERRRVPGRARRAGDADAVAGTQIASILPSFRGWPVPPATAGRPPRAGYHGPSRTAGKPGQGGPMSKPQRDPYPDALRAGALLVVVLGHWIATLPRLRDGRRAQTEHLLAACAGAAVLTWRVQVGPLVVFVSAAFSPEGVPRRVGVAGPARWWAARALALARPTVTYLAVLVLLAVAALASGGRLLGLFDQSLTVHLWFLLMLLTVQALLPWSLRMDERWGLGAVAGLVVVAAALDVLRADVSSA